MKGAFFVRMAGQGVMKNKRLYLPYLITSIGLVMMDYILAFLAQSRVIRQNMSAAVAPEILNIGTQIIAFFSLLFLFYSNALIMRRRKREFGLYNILGLDKWGLTRMILWESLITAGLSLILGLGFGVLFSKLAELGLCNMLHLPVSFDFSVNQVSLIGTAVLFAVIFVLILLNDVRQVWFSKPIDLLQSESAGEKPPKGNLFIGLLGLILLGASYYIAATIQNPVTALAIFFVAVAMVIAGTYLIFIAGSVSLCRFLQRRKRYYYQSSHFVSVSSMLYRMKRNGAGLASICILLTMVLVMIGASMRLYIGTEEGLRNRFTRDFSVKATFESLNDLTAPNLAALQSDVEAAATEANVPILDSRAHLQFSGTAFMRGSRLTFDGDYNDMNYLSLVILPLSYYTEATGEMPSLAPGEALYDLDMLSWPFDGVLLGQEGSETVYRLHRIPAPIPDMDSTLSVNGHMTLIVPDGDFLPLLRTAILPALGEDVLVRYTAWTFAFDTDASAAAQRTAYNNIQNLSARYEGQPAPTDQYHVKTMTCLNREYQRPDFVDLYGGFLYLGILLSLVFLFAAVMIIYYKQISEGYEDQARFAIMRKVGMTRRDIRKSVNSQMLTVFFLPLLFAGLHLLFAIPILAKLMRLFYFTRLSPLLWTCGISFLFFGLLYAMAYRMTSNSYYQIVSGSMREK